MKKQNQSIDDFFRDVLKDHTTIPSEAARTAFLKEVADVTNSKKSGKRWFLLLLSGIVVVMSGIGVYFAMNTTNTSNPSSTKGTTSSMTKTAASLLSSSTSNPPLQKNTKQDHDKIQTNLTITAEIKSPSVARKNPPEKTTVLNSPPGKKSNEQVQAIVSTEIQKEENQIHNSPEENSEKLQDTKVESVKPPSTEISQSNIPDTLNKLTHPATDPSGNTVSASQGKKSNQEKLYRNWQISTGIYYSPEWMFNIIEGDKFVNSFGLEGTIHSGNYSIRTGAGLSITQGANELSILYNDYLGDYKKLDSMSFKWNEEHNKLVPTYFLSDKSVYDSLMKLDNARIVKRYTYLQVPLILGYDLWRNERFSFGFRAGPILSVLLTTKQISGEYEPGKNKIIAINQISPERIQTNWQIMGGINATFNLSEQIGIELEPEVRYYFNSVYEKSDNTKKPWSAGFRVAFLINY